MSSRSCFILAVAALLAGCGRGRIDSSTGSAQFETTSASRALGLDPLPLPPPPPPPPAPSLTPIVIVEEPIPQAPVAPPTIASVPLGPTLPVPTPVPLPSLCAVTRVAMQVLVIAATGNEPSLGAIQQALGFHTIPFTTWIASSNPGMLTPDKLATGCDGKYQGVILATGNLAFSADGGLTYVSALTATEWLALRNYESTFKVREISWYVYPGVDQGLNPPSSGVDTSTSPINATLTSAGRSVFTSVNAANPIPISMAWTYLAKPSDPNVTPLLVDGVGNALASSRVTSDGRETIALTFDTNQWLIQWKSPLYVLTAVVSGSLSSAP